MQQAARKIFNPDKGINKILHLIVKEKKLVNDATPSLDIFDFDYFEARMRSLHDAFPEPFFVHALAMKANSMRSVLGHASKMGFMGAEAASIAEVVHAISCGFPASKVVYDSPCKSKASNIVNEQRMTFGLLDSRFVFYSMIYKKHLILASSSTWTMNLKWRLWMNCSRMIAKTRLRQQ